MVATEIKQKSMHSTNHLVLINKNTKCATGNMLPRYNSFYRKIMTLTKVCYKIMEYYYH